MEPEHDERGGEAEVGLRIADLRQVFGEAAEARTVSSAAFFVWLLQSRWAILRQV